MKRKTPKPTFPVVRVVGLLSFSAFTLAGILTGLPPEVVLARVAIGTAVVMAFALTLVRLLAIPSI